MSKPKKTNNIPCFFMEPTESVALYLRRYSAHETPHWHNTMVRIEDAPVILDADGHRDARHVEDYAADPRWPLTCYCGYEYAEKDMKQVFQDLIYKRADTGEVFPFREAPVGAMWWSDWAFEKGWDGRSLVVRVPGPHDWHVDGRANNCDRLDDDDHRCWVRSGEPPNVTVDKNGNTCNAGAGSILVPNWHGFLTAGNLVEC